MTAYIIKRLLFLPVSILLLTLFVFTMIRLIPGDAVDAKLQNNYGKDQAAKLRKEYGIDQPAWKQYFVWIGNVSHGEFGDSFITARSIGNEIEDRLPVTAELLVLVVMMQVPLGVTIGVIAALGRDRPQDYVARLISILFLAVPAFWLATLVVILPSVWWGWALPVGYTQLWANPSRNLYQLSVPAVLAALASSAVLMRLTRSQMLEVLGSDYIRTARAKGLPNFPVVWRHALRNALIPLVTVIGLGIGAGFASGVVLETVFSIPGLGQYTVNALVNRDYPAIQAVVLLVGTIFTVTNLVVDLSYTVIDPRIRYS